MNGLEKIIEEKGILVFISPAGRIMALNVNDFSSAKAKNGFSSGDKAGKTEEGKISPQKTTYTDQIFQEGKPVHVLLQEDMVQLQRNDYFWSEDALWLRYGGILHKKIVENHLQKYVDKEVYSE